MYQEKKMNIAGRLLTMLLLAVALAGCTSGTDQTTTTSQISLTTTDVRSQATLSRFRKNEIREYQGVRLDPAIGPRDNSISGVQLVDMDAYMLRIDGLVERPVNLAYADVLALESHYRRITLYCVEGWQATVLWQGVLLTDLISQAGAKPDAVTVIFHCADDYTTSLPLQTIEAGQLILAYQANALPLPPEMGFPFIVIAEDKWGYKWARWVTRIELSSDADYKGFWESRGFSNEGALD